MFDAPAYSIRECREKDLTYEQPLFMTVRFVNKSTGEIREQRVFMGNIPQMTDAGTFIINGTERVVVTQLVRSPGAYIMEPKDPTKQVFTANLMPARGSWLELEIDKKGLVFVRIDRKRKLHVTTLLRALPAGGPDHGRAFASTDDDEAIRDPDTGEPNVYIDLTLEKDREDARGGAGRGVQEAAPGRAADARELEGAAARALLRPEALRPHAGRPLQAELAARPRGRSRRRAC